MLASSPVLLSSTGWLSLEQLFLLPRPSNFCFLSSSVNTHVVFIPAASHSLERGCFQSQDFEKVFGGILLVSAVLAVFPGLQSNFAVAILDTEVGCIVSRLHRSSEECPTGWAHLKAGSSSTLPRPTSRDYLGTPRVLCVLGGGFQTCKCFERNCTNNLTTSQAFESISGEFL